MSVFPDPVTVYHQHYDDCKDKAEGEHGEEDFLLCRTHHFICGGVVFVFIPEFLKLKCIEKVYPFDHLLGTLAQLLG